MVSVDTAARDSGTDSPADTARTLLWCLQGGDISRAASLLAFEPAERERLQAFINTLPDKIRAEYDSPEKLIAFVIAGSPKPLAGVQLLAENQPDANTTVQRVRLEYQSGEVREDQIKFQRSTDGWKQVISPSTVDRVIAYFKAK